MDKKTIEEVEARFEELMNGESFPVDEVISMLSNLPINKAQEWIAKFCAKALDARDFNTLLAIYTNCAGNSNIKFNNIEVRDSLKKSTADRTLLSFVDAVRFDARDIRDSLNRLNSLISFTPGKLVFCDAWGLGEIKRIDSFYRKLTVDFRTRKGHQFAFDAACEMLTFPKEDHILVVAYKDSAKIESMKKDAPGELVKAFLSCFGNMPVSRLEELISLYGLVSASEWKNFWDKARGDLRKDKMVKIPARRAEPLVLKEQAEDYGDNWLTAFVSITDAKEVLAQINEYNAAGKMKTASDDVKAKISDRLEFAALSARGTDIALYTRVALVTKEFGLSAPSIADMRTYLVENDRYIDAARKLPARDVKGLLELLLSDEASVAETKKMIFAAIPEMNFAFVSEIIEHFKDDTEFRKLIGDMLRDSNAPATVVTYVTGHRGKFEDWQELPSLLTILYHAIVLGEGRQNGEKLQMQNIIRRLFADEKWVNGILDELKAKGSDGDMILFFERFQASFAWDVAKHQLITKRMTKHMPELETYVTATAAPVVVERITSIRSYMEREAEYQDLINKQIPANAKKIDEARGYGDLRENFEYQAAKDEQRALLQKQTLMQQDLKDVKAVDFANASTDEVNPGTMVTIVNTAGEEVIYTILGEWDNDLEARIISNKAQLAKNMLGKKVGDKFEMSDAQGVISEATIKAIAGLSPEMVNWVKNS